MENLRHVMLLLDYLIINFLPYALENETLPTCIRTQAWGDIVVWRWLWPLFWQIWHDFFISTNFDSCCKTIDSTLPNPKAPRHTRWNSSLSPPALIPLLPNPKASRHAAGWWRQSVCIQTLFDLLFWQNWIQISAAKA